MHKEQQEISHIQKREIQAPVVTEIIKGFIEEFGKKETMEVLSRVIAKDAAESGRMLREKYNGNGIKELSLLIKEVWCEDDAMEIEILKENEKEFHFNVTKCRYAEVYENLGTMELGKCLSCDRDLSFNDGFNPAIKLKRSGTIMEGNEVCDFRYTIVG